MAGDVTPKHKLSCSTGVLPTPSVSCSSLIATQSTPPATRSNNDVVLRPSTSFKSILGEGLWSRLAWLSKNFYTPLFGEKKLSGDELIEHLKVVAAEYQQLSEHDDGDIWAGDTAMLAIVSGFSRLCDNLSEEKQVLLVCRQKQVPGLEYLLDASCDQHYQQMFDESKNITLSCFDEKLLSEFSRSLSIEGVHIKSSIADIRRHYIYYELSLDHFLTFLRSHYRQMVGDRLADITFDNAVYSKLSIDMKTNRDAIIEKVINDIWGVDVILEGQCQVSLLDVLPDVDEVYREKVEKYLDASKHTLPYSRPVVDKLNQLKCFDGELTEAFLSYESTSIIRQLLDSY